MIKIFERDFMTTKEASKRYGFSVGWLMDRRLTGLDPDFCQNVERGRVLYDVEKTDEWFKRFMKMETDA